MIPDFQTVMLPLLREVAAGQGSTKELVPKLADRFALTELERAEMLGSGRQTRFANRVHWALAYLGKAGLLERTGRGTYRVTPDGNSLLAAPPERITINLLSERYDAFREFRPPVANGAPTGDGAATAVAAPSAPAATPEDVIAAAVAAIEATLRADLLHAVRALPPPKFEQLLLDLLVALGFGGGRASAARGERLGQSGDGGVDGVIREDALGLDVVRIQAKRHAEANPVGPEAIQAFAGSLLERGATKGVFATTSRFTEGARRAAERVSTQRRIVRIDGDELARLMIEHGVGVRATQSIKLQRVHLSDYDDDDDAQPRPYAAPARAMARIA